MNRSKYLRKFRAVILVLSFLTASLVSLTACPQQTQAAPTVTMYPGDKFTVWVEPSFDCAKKKIKSSNSKVADVADEDKNKNLPTSVLHLTAKKPGKATISGKVIGSSRTAKLNVVVKKLDFTAKLLSFQDGGKLVLSVKNNMKVSFQNCRVEIAFRDKDGKLIKKGSWFAHGPLAGKTAYSTVNMWSAGINLTIEERKQVDVSKCTVEVTAIERSSGRDDVVKNTSSKIKKTDEEMEDDGAGHYRFHCMLKNTSKEDMAVNVFVKLYDEDNRLIDILTESIFSFDGKEERDVVLEAYQNFVPGYDHYKIEVQAHYTKRVKNGDSNRIRI